jgi:hypothetical protein
MAEQGLVVEHHELFNKINNMDILTIIHFVPSAEEGGGKSGERPVHLKKSMNYPYPSSPLDEINFSVDTLFPFLSKSENFAIGQKKMPRQFLFTFPKTGSVNEEVNNAIVAKFIELVKQLGGRVSNEDYVLDDREKLLSSDPPEEKDENVTFKFTARILVLKGYYDDFYEKYKSCFPLFQSKPTAQRRSNYKNIAYYASEIIPHFLFLGDYLNGSEPEQLSALDITHVVDATGHETSRKTCEALQISYLPVNIWDMEDAPIHNHFEEVLTFLDTAYENFQTVSHITSESIVHGETTVSRPVLPPRVLVHCRAGWSRSTTFVLVFLMHKLRMPLRDALIHTVKQRPMICPNEGFREQLITYEKDLFGVQSVTDIHDALRVLRKYGLLWTDQSVNSVETDFDRIPIQAFKKKMTATEYEIPVETNAEAGGVGETVVKEAKPKKPFLKRGEGKRIAKPVNVSTSDVEISCDPKI